MLDRTGGLAAKLHYRSGDYAVVQPGNYVVCAVTGQRVPLEELRYWSAEHQEAYATAEAALTRLVRRG